MVAIYIHWPFCKAKCPYCDFNSHVSRVPLQEAAWQQALLGELDYFLQKSDYNKGTIISSVFFGGGTPSLMPPDIVARLLEGIEQRFTVLPDCEITLEANPTSSEAGRFADFQKAGINRLSMGIQALNDNDLKKLGRQHSVSEALAAFEMAQNIFSRLSFDLIYARMGQSLSDWQMELTTAISYAVDHLSLYQLTIEEGTPFYQRHQKGKLHGLPDEILAADMYNLTNDILQDAGFTSYEISNYAKPGAQSRHNLTYWHYNDYIGIGPGAHGRISSQKQRYATSTICDPAQWLHNMKCYGHACEEFTPITTVMQAREFLMMGLRLINGIMWQNCPLPMKDCINIDRLNVLKNKGLLYYDQDGLYLEKSGRLLLNAILAEILL